MNKNKYLHEDCGVGVDPARRRMAGVAGVGLIAAGAATLWPLRTAQAQSAVIYTPLETLVALVRAGAEAVATAVDAGRLRAAGATLIGTRLVATSILERIKASETYRAGAGDAIERVVGDLGALLGVARGPRLARQAALGRTLLGTETP